MHTAMQAVPSPADQAGWRSPAPTLYSGDGPAPAGGQARWEVSRPRPVPSPSSPACARHPFLLVTAAQA